MPKKFKSQWDFGELFQPSAMRRVLTVTEVTNTIRRVLEKEMGEIWVAGEVTNLRCQSSGHIYFTLKDASAQLHSICFRDEARSSRHLLKDGQKVVLQGELSVYEQRGQYQLLVRFVELQGIGALQLAFEKLKQKLNAEGLFALERKRPLPSVSRCIGVVTSPTGAALHDLLHVIERRQRWLEIVLVPCRVQGAGAAEQIAEGIHLLNQWAFSNASVSTGRRGLDLILVTRGGGSLEDLWAFNEEVVARAIFESRLPVVSAVGHEIDFTISDLVADVRAATPSAAGEIITERAVEGCKVLSETQPYLCELAINHVRLREKNLRGAMQRLTRLDPRRRLNQRLQFLDDLQLSLMRCARRAWQRQVIHQQHLAASLMRVRPLYFWQRWKARLDAAEQCLAEVALDHLHAAKRRVEKASERLRLLSPLQVLGRGYSITMDEASGAVIRAGNKVVKGQRLRTRVAQGELSSVVD